MAVITADIPKDLNRKLELDKRRYGLSKSYLVRAILQHHYELNHPLSVGGHRKPRATTEA